MKAIVLTLIVTVLVRASKSIRCSVPNVQECYQKQEAVSLADGKYLTCKIKAVQNLPKSTIKDKTAQTPESMNADWYIHNEKRIALNVSWVHKVDYLRSVDFKGFFLEVEVRMIQIMYMTSIQIVDNPFNLTIINNATDTVTFNFLCFGRQGQIIRPKEERTVSLHSVPLPTREYKMLTKVKKVIIPDCLNKRRGRELMKIRDQGIVRNRKICKNFWQNHDEQHSSTTEISTSKSKDETIFPNSRYDYTLFNYPKEQTEDTPERLWKVIMPMVMGMLLVSAFGATILILKRSRKPKKINQDFWHAEVLLVVDTTEQSALRRCCALSQYLKENFNLMITRSWEHTQEIAASFAEWYSDIQADIIIIIKFAEESKHGEIREHCRKNMKPNEAEIVEKRLLNDWVSQKKDIIFLVPPRLVTQHQSKQLRKHTMTYAFQERYGKNDGFHKHIAKFEKNMPTESHKEEMICKTSAV